MMTPARPTPDDDPWEKLEEDLFGIEFGKEHAASEPAEESAGPAAAEPAATSDDAALLPPSLPPEPERPPVPTAAPEPTAMHVPADVPHVPAPRETIESEGGGPPAPLPRDDSFWDVLANWSWDESGGGGSERPADAGRPGPRERPSRESRPPRRDRDRADVSLESPSEKAPDKPRPPRKEAGRSMRERNVEDDAFGQGLGGEPPVREPAPIWDEVQDEEDLMPPPAQVPVSQDFEPDAGTTGPRTERPATDEDAGSDRPRRRRRRRRGKPGEGEPESDRPERVAPRVEPARELTSEVEEMDTELDDEIDEREARPAPAAEGSPSEGRGGSRRRRGRGARGPMRPERPVPERPVKEPVSEIDDEEEEDELSESPLESILMDDEGELEATGEIDLESEDDEIEHVVNYGDVPTWEEAISYLLKPSQVQVDPALNSANKDPHRPTRHLGRRRS